MCNRLFVRIVLAIVAFAYLPMHGNAQSQPVPTFPIDATLPPSPNAASLGIYGQIPVSLFNGLPQVSIPFLDLPVDEADVNIGLSYHGGGIHPDEHPGWVGLGWNLDAGGVITRKVNGFADEMLLSRDGYPEDISSYYSHYAVANNPNWAAADTLIKYLTPTISSGVYPAPDEFMFNFGSYSGSFFLDHHGQWQVHSTTPLYLKVQEQLMTPFSLAPYDQSGQPVNIRRIFYSFTLTTPDGCQYTFGGNGNAIEFSRNATAYVANDIYGNTVVPTSWYLTKITTRSGKVVNFSYEGAQVVASQSSVFLFTKTHDASSGSSADVKSTTPGFSISIQTPRYLASIETPYQKVSFFRSNSHELAYAYDPAVAGAAKWSDIGTNGAGIVTKVVWKKLDSIAVYEKDGTFQKKWELTYKDTVTSRLMLKSVQESSYDFKKGAYTFSYDTTSLPPYNSQMLDHWGFYNGRNFFGEHAATYIYDTTDVSAYTASRAPNASFMKAGILTGITYPTGGSTTFEYEPHDYSMVVNHYPNTVSNLATNVMAGGLRIRRITNKDGVTGVTQAKTYLYKLNYAAGGTLSSGVSAGNPVYMDKGYINTSSVTFAFWYNNPIQPLSYTNGSHVTYSEVTELLPDSSYIVYNYSNHDQSRYLDQVPLIGVFNTGTSFWPLIPNTSLSLERGKLLRHRFYLKNNLLLKDVQNSYDESAPRFTDAGRIINIAFRKIQTSSTPTYLVADAMSAYLLYYFPQYLKQTIETNYDMNGANPIQSKKTFTYDTLYRLIKTDSLTTGDGKIYTTNYSYVTDPSAFSLSLGSTDPRTCPFTYMLKRNMVQTPVEIRKRVYDSKAGDQFLSAQVLTYGSIRNVRSLASGIDSFNTVPIASYELNGTVAAPVTGYSNFHAAVSASGGPEINTMDARLIKMEDYTDYDAYGNVGTAVKRGKDSTSFIWANASSQPLAKVTNASSKYIRYTSFESRTTKDNITYDDSAIVTHALTGKYGYQLNKLLASGAKSVISLSGFSDTTSYVISFWSSNTGVQIVFTGTQTSQVGGTINGWTFYRSIVKGSTSYIIKTDNATADIDELRVYPVGSQMASLVFKEGVGPTAITDPKGDISFFEYDGLGRLRVTRDRDWNILKVYTYDYNGLPTNMGLFKSNAQSGLYSNTCGPNFLTSSTQITLPAGAQTSFISQQDADAKAKAELDSIGPIQANQGLPCQCDRQGYKLINGVCEQGYARPFAKNVNGVCQTWDQYVFSTGLDPVKYNVQNCQ